MLMTEDKEAVLAEVGRFIDANDVNDLHCLLEDISSKGHHAVLLHMQGLVVAEAAAEWRANPAQESRESFKDDLVDWADGLGHVLAIASPPRPDDGAWWRSGTCSSPSFKLKRTAMYSL